MSLSIEKPFFLQLKEGSWNLTLFFVYVVFQFMNFLFPFRLLIKRLKLHFSRENSYVSLFRIPYFIFTDIFVNFEDILKEQVQNFLILNFLFTFGLYYEYYMTGISIKYLLYCYYLWGHISLTRFLHSSVKRFRHVYLYVFW